MCATLEKVIPPGQNSPREFLACVINIETGKNVEIVSWIVNP